MIPTSIENPILVHFKSALKAARRLKKNFIQIRLLLKSDL